MSEPDTEKPLAIGDTVSLKSGGHAMTIVAMDGNTAECVWSVKGDCKSKSLPIIALTWATSGMKPVYLTIVESKAEAGPKSKE